jgi:hypothetical protein
MPAATTTLAVGSLGLVGLKCTFSECLGVASMLIVVAFLRRDLVGLLFLLQLII